MQVSTSSNEMPVFNVSVSESYDVYYLVSAVALCCYCWYPSILLDLHSGGDVSKTSGISLPLDATEARAAAVVFQP